MGRAQRFGMEDEGGGGMDVEGGWASDRSPLARFSPRFFSARGGAADISTARAGGGGGAATAPIGVIPDDHLLEIFRRLPIRQRLMAQSVCTKWRRLMYHPGLWTSLHLADVPGFSASQVARLFDLSRDIRGRYNLQKLDASGAWGLDVAALLPALARCSFLQHLILVKGATGRPQVTASCLEALLSLGGGSGWGSEGGFLQGGQLYSTSSGGSIVSRSPSSSPPVRDGSPAAAVRDETRGRTGGRGGSSSSHMGNAMTAWRGRACGSSSPEGKRGRPRVVVDLEVDWSYIGEPSGSSGGGGGGGGGGAGVTAAQWELVLAGLAGDIEGLTVRALYIEVLDLRDTWPRVLAALRANAALQELHVVCLYCETHLVGEMVRSLGAVLQSAHALHTLVLKYANLIAPSASLRPLLQLSLPQPPSSSSPSPSPSPSSSSSSSLSPGAADVRTSTWTGARADEGGSGGGGGGGGRGLRRLEIVRSAHSKRVVAELAEFVAAEHAHVEELALELGECAAGVVAALAANSHSRLRLLRLGGSVPESAAVALAHALRAGTTGLREVDLRGGLLATPGVLQAMADALAENTMLTCLRMDCGDFDASESTRDKVAAAMEALVGAVERRGGLHTLGLSIPAGFWASPAAALLCAWPKRFSPPPLARLLSGASPLVTVLHLTAPYDDWRFGAAAAWRFWLGLSRGTPLQGKHLMRACSRRAPLTAPL
eukprot:jgi/Mesen1/5897/ME000003S06928